MKMPSNWLSIGAEGDREIVQTETVIPISPDLTLSDRSFLRVIVAVITHSKLFIDDGSERPLTHSSLQHFKKINLFFYLSGITIKTGKSPYKYGLSPAGYRKIYKTAVLTYPRISLVHKVLHLLVH